MRFFVDGRLDVRPLTAQDRANEPLPYDDLQLTYEKTELADEEEDANIWDEDDWGTGKDCFITGFTLFVFCANPFLVDDADTFAIIIDDSITGEFFYVKGFTGKDTEISQISNAFVPNLLLYTKLFEKIRRVRHTEQNIRVSVYNDTGQEITVRVHVSYITPD